jgi:hypothetical protein
LSVSTSEVLNEQNKRGQDTDNLALTVSIFDAGEEKREAKDIDNLALSVSTSEALNENSKRGQDTDNLALSVSIFDAVDEKREAKLISPYTDDVEKADPHAVLGEKH